MKQKHISKAQSAMEMSLRSWWSISKRIVTNVQKHNIPLISAGVAFYCLLAIFPLLGATIALYGLVVSADELQKHMALIVDVVPRDSRYIIEEQLTNLTEKNKFSARLELLTHIIIVVVEQQQRRECPY